MGALPQSQLSVDEFLAWAEGHQEGRFELVRGRVNMMSPETNRHAITKLNLVRVFDQAIKQAGLDCVAMPDGAGIKTADGTVREPDASIQGGAVDLDAMTLDQPLVVAEVISPSSVQTDTAAKLEEYFSVASIEHYLIVDPYNFLVVHHYRAGGRTGRSVHTDGSVSLDPPGLVLPVSAFFEGLK